FYVATTRFNRQDNAQISLQRQGAFIIEEMARQIRPATALTSGICNGHVNALQGTIGGQRFFFYVLNNVPYEDWPGGGTENLLQGSLVPLTVSSFVVNDLSNAICPDGTSGCQIATITLQIQDNVQNSMAFKTTLGRRNHN